MHRLATALFILTVAGAVSAADTLSEFSAALAKAGRDWEYSKTENEMTGEVTETTAMFQSRDAPYMQLVIRNSKDDGLQAYAFPDGEVNCPGACQLLVRADDAAPKSFAVTVRRFEFGSYRLDFADVPALIQYVRNAKRVRVQLRYLDIPKNREKGEVVWTVNPKTPLVIHPLRKAVGQ
ncbi:hypothetical protein [uncultured Methylibium sp.]|uniref:hypothetical protein n=1 Tax=uncultured Methylibium sp. TaxID=381093 RepID=UPI0025D3052E|nr:hypothetical protein [uncultured Methylibium sp.]